MQPAVLITGGAKRIGRAIALALAREGFNVALHYNTSRKEAEQVAREIAALGRQCELFQRDLNDLSAVRSLMPAVLEALPACEVLVNNASIFERAGFADTEEALFERHFNINFRAPFFLSRDFAAGLGDRAGHIVNLLDTKVAQVFTPYFAYALSKKALASFTEMAARALAPRIRVNGVCPGLILPPPGQDADALEKLARRVPLQRTGTPEAVAAAVVFLVNNDYLTGQAIYVDGGEHLTGRADVP